MTRSQTIHRSTHRCNVEQHSKPQAPGNACVGIRVRRQGLWQRLVEGKMIGPVFKVLSRPVSPRQRGPILQHPRRPLSGSLRLNRRIGLIPLLWALTLPYQMISAEPGSAPRMMLDTLQVTGDYWGDEAVEVFRGIPFAEPPVGTLRWMPPQPLPSIPQQLTATRFAPACYQGEHITKWYQGVVKDFGGDPNVIKTPKVSEDCLYLNLWRPKGAKQPLPIVVFIHGGSNRGGYSYEPNYLGHRLAAQGVIVITVAYRLGVFGYFAHEALAGSNFGLLDQIQALQFIRQHSADFGGDPDRITIMGESSGANSINFLIASPLAQGLFQRALHQSGGSAVDRETDPAAARHLGNRLIQLLTGLSGQAALNTAKQLPAEQVLAAAEALYEGFYFDPLIDGTSVVRPPRESLDSGRVASIDLLIGTNRDERLMYLDPEQKLDDWLAENLSEPQRLAVLPLLAPFSSDSRALDVLSTAQTYVCPSLRLAAHLSTIKKDIYVYEFNKVRPGKMAASMGAYHGAELPYVFDTHDDWLPTDEDDRALTKLMQHYWGNFIKTGNPNSSAAVPWPRYQSSTGQVLRLDQTSDAGRHASASVCQALANH
jgi:para-nitrobenzyl esterase